MAPAERTIGAVTRGFKPRLHWALTTMDLKHVGTVGAVMRTDHTSAAAFVELSRLQMQAEKAERRLASLARGLGAAAETPMVTSTAPATQLGVTGVLLLAAWLYLVL